MKNRTPRFSRSDVILMTMSLMVIATLSGCIGFVGRPRQGFLFVAPIPVAAVAVAPVVVVEPTPVAVVVVQDDYIYYPGYEVYYSPSRQAYFYLQGGIWVTGPVPGRIPQANLRAAPSVKMSFRDAPGNHHAATVQQYPKNWNPNQQQSDKPRK